MRVEENSKNKSRCFKALWPCPQFGCCGFKNTQSSSGSILCSAVESRARLKTTFSLYSLRSSLNQKKFTQKIRQQACICFVFERARAPMHVLLGKGHPMRKLHSYTIALRATSQSPGSTGAIASVASVKLSSVWWMDAKQCFYRHYSMFKKWYLLYALVQI